MYKNIYQTDLSPVLTLWVLADSWEWYIELSNSGLLPSPPPSSFSVSTTVPCQLSRGCKSYFANHKIKDTPAPSKKPPATQARMMQLEKSLCRDNDTETNCLCPQKFHHLLQKIMVRRPLSAVSHYCTWENGQCHRALWGLCESLSLINGISDGTVRLVRM